MNPKSRTPVIVGVVAVVVAIVAVLAIVMSGDGDSDANDGSATDSSSPATESIGETLPVTVTGDVLPTFGEEADDPAIGTAAPVVDGQGFDGTSITVGGPTENSTLVVFLAHWCPHCNAEIPELIELKDRGDIPTDLDVVGVSTAVTADRPNYPPSEWLVDKQWPWPAMADDEAATAFQSFGSSGFPFLVILDPEGNVVARQSGESSADEIQEWIEENLASANVT